MPYTKEFIEEVKRVYPNAPEIIKCAEDGDYFLGRYLDDNCESSISIEFIENHSYKELMEKVKRIKEKRELYYKWCNGSAYVGGADRENYCPINHMQNSNDTDREKFAEIICKNVEYVCCFYDCKKYGCKEQCWQKYDELKKKNGRG